MKNKTIRSIMAALICINLGCQDEFLDKKPDQALLVPTSIADFQALLDNSEAVMNFSPVLTTISSDDFTSLENISAMPIFNKNSYLWEQEIYQGGVTTDFSTPYQQIFYANIVLDGLKKLDRFANASEYDRIHGSALFFRAMAYYQLAIQFCPVYSKDKASLIPGMMIRNTADVNDRPKRSSLEETFQLILGDLKLSLQLIGAKEPAERTRPGKQAVLGLLSRVYLQMEEYQLALDAAKQAREIKGSMLDYKSFMASSNSQTNPFPVWTKGLNPEIIFYSSMLVNPYLSAASTVTDTELRESYQAGDLRSELYFFSRTATQWNFKGSYSGNTTWFTGIAVDELYLIRSECELRTGNSLAALATLNSLLSSRYRSGTFQPLVQMNEDVLLKKILLERRKELVGRGLRWADLKRLNNDKATAIDLQRNVNGMIHTLKAKDAKYAFPLPDSELIDGDVVQNPR